jgi:hypothetical protein
LRRVFNPAEFRHLKLSNLYCAPGHERTLLDLIESLLKQEGYYTGMMFMDKRSALYASLAALKSWGFLNALTETPIELFATWEGLSPAATETLSRSPAYFSPRDLC